ncbi:hypothetical protein L9F63_027585 [Diploptera punctata]|nr:hypothetical protein L9F63_027585 [Diploptera punctata]
MLVPVDSTSSFPGASLFQQIPNPVQQKSQQVPVINSPITPSYSLMDYETPRTTETTNNYSNIMYNDSAIGNLSLNYPIMYDRDLQTTDYSMMNYISRPTYGKEKIIIEGTNCVPTITKASNVFPSVSRSNVEQVTVSNVFPSVSRSNVEQVTVSNVFPSVSRSNVEQVTVSNVFPSVSRSNVEQVTVSDIFPNVSRSNVEQATISNVFPSVSRSNVEQVTVSNIFPNVSRSNVEQATFPSVSRSNVEQVTVSNIFPNVSRSNVEQATISNVFPSVSRSNVEQVTVPNTTSQRLYSCKKTGKLLATDIDIPYIPPRTMQSDLHWRKRTIELSQQEDEMNAQIELDWKRY